jgi:predicted nucleic acid-binding protein
MREVALIADTSCLIALTKANGVYLLRELYSEIYITEEVANEFGEELPTWIIIRKVNDFSNLKILATILDLGEASSIALAFEFESPLLVLDDLKARKEATKLGFKITGTLGILYQAKMKGLIPAIQPKIEQLSQAGFRIATSVVEELLRRSGE